VVGFEDRSCRFAQEVELAELVGNPRQRLRHREADRGIAITDHTRNRHAYRTRHRAQQRRQIMGGAEE
jgi:hypothetical protein